MIYDALASQIYNNVYSGIRGYHQNMSLTMEQVEQSIVEERLLIIKEYTLRGILPKKDLLVSINCIPVDCDDLDRCGCRTDAPQDDLVAHIEIPLVALDFGVDAIEYLGSTDRQLPFLIYTNAQALKYNKYRKRGKKKPFAFLDYTANVNNKNDVFLFNVPLLKQVSIVFVPKDLRQLEDYTCCNLDEVNLSFLNTEIVKRLTEKYLRWFRQMQAPIQPNDQNYQ